MKGAFKKKGNGEGEKKMNVKFQSFSRARVNKLWHGIKSALFLSKVLLKHHHTHLVGTVKGSFHSAVAKFSSCRPTEPQIFTIWPFNNSKKKKKKRRPISCPS